MTQQRFELTDIHGLRVVSEHVPWVRSVSLGVWVATGSRDESADTRGYAHFLEHLLFKGNERIDAEGISGFFDGIGADIDASTSREQTVVHTRVPDTHVSEALRVLGEMAVAPALAQSDVDSEREVILEEIAMYEDTPSDLVHEIADQLTFANHPLGTPVLGTPETIAAASRGALKEFHRRHYTRPQLVLSAAGNCTHGELVAAVEQQFFVAELPGAGPREQRQMPTDASEATACIQHKDTEQVHVCLSGRGIPRTDERRYAAALLDILLGGNASSRLFVQIRERRGLAYSVYSFNSMLSDTGQVGIYFGVRPDRLEEALSVVREELAGLVARPPSDLEVERAQAHLKGRILLSMESTGTRNNRLGSALICGMPIDPVETTLARIDAVTARDLHALAQELLPPERLHLAAVADDVAAARSAALTAWGVPEAAFLPEAIAS